MNNYIIFEKKLIFQLIILKLKMLKVQKLLMIFQLIILITLILFVGSYLNKIELKNNKHDLYVQIYRSEIEICYAERAPGSNEDYINNINQSKTMASYFLNESESNITLICSDLLGHLKAVVPAVKIIKTDA